MLPFTQPTIGEEDQQAVLDVLKSGWLATGPKVLELEKALVNYLGGNISVRLFNSGTSALEASLLASDIGPGDEVIVPAMSFVATANVVLRVGATPVFVDVGLNSRNLNVENVTAALTDKTRAIIPVHFAGLAVDMEPLYQLATQHNLLIIEDAAQAIGTSYRGNKIGHSGNPVCFSFHPNKNMTTIEGGAVASNDPAFIKRIEQIRFHGIERDDLGGIDVSAWGGKMNLTDVGAALGLVQLGKLDKFNEKRKKLANLYFQQLPVNDLLTLPANDDGHSWHMFCVCIDHNALNTNRDTIQKLFQKAGIGLGVHYPAIHLFSLYRRMGYTEGNFPNAEKIGAQTFTLPLFPNMNEENVKLVCDTVKAVLAGNL